MDRFMDRSRWKPVSIDGFVQRANAKGEQPPNYFGGESAANPVAPRTSQQQPGNGSLGDYV
jgi:hypothetical protein